MTAIDTRNIKRDSLFLMADLHIEGAETPQRVKVRNLSDTGAMLEGDVPVREGQRATVAISQVGSLGGSVAWVQNTRFGLAFDAAIDASKVRIPLVDEDTAAPRYTRPAIAVREPIGTVRKV